MIVTGQLTVELLWAILVWRKQNVERRSRRTVKVEGNMLAGEIEAIR